MAQVGLTKAAELTGKAPSTITRRTKHKDPKKRLGFTVNDGGEKLYDVAELERAFGKLHAPQKNENANENAIVRNSANASERNDLQQQLNDALEAKNALLHDKIALLHAQLEDMRQDRNEWREQMKNSTRLLEDQRKKPDTDSNSKGQGTSPETKQPKKSLKKPVEKKKGFWGSLFSS